MAHTVVVDGGQIANGRWDDLIRSVRILIAHEKKDGRNIDKLGLRLQFFPIENNPRVPKLGDLVHYVLPEKSVYRGDHRPAFVTHVHPLDATQVRLHVLAARSDDFADRDSTLDSVRVFLTLPNGGETNKITALTGLTSYSSDYAPGTWHYPEET